MQYLIEKLNYLGFNIVTKRGGYTTLPIIVIFFANCTSFYINFFILF